RRTALKARTMNNRRRLKERQAANRPAPAAPAEVREHLHALLDQELAALPDKYRAAIVLCDLESKAIKEAARQLGCPQGTVGTRLARGRTLLARRLARQGLPLFGGMFLTSLTKSTAAAGVPAPLAAATIKAVAYAAKTSWVLCTSGPAPLVSAKVAALTK